MDRGKKRRSGSGRESEERENKKEVGKNTIYLSLAPFTYLNLNRR